MLRRHLLDLQGSLIRNGRTNSGWFFGSGATRSRAEVTEVEVRALSRRRCGLDCRWWRGRLERSRCRRLRRLLTATPSRGGDADAERLRCGYRRTAQSAANETGLTTSVWDWKGLRVDKIQFEGVTFDPTDTLPQELAQKVGTPLDPEQVRASLRRLFASGRYRDISVRGVRQGDAVTLIFAGAARYYVGRVTIDGVKNDRLASLLEFATKLSPGTAFNESQIAAGDGGDQGHTAAAGVLRVR